MLRRLEFWGSLVTMGYFAFLWFLIGDKLLSLKTMELNNIGDFLAGVFGPVAFLWLVLGFLQQGTELKLQAQELRNSVQQQAEIAAATKEQAEAQRRAMEADRARYEDQFLARLIFRPKHTITSQGMRRKYFDIQNLGGDAINLTMGMDPPRDNSDLKRLGMLGRSGVTEVSMEFDDSSGDITATLILNYETLQGLPQTALFDFKFVSESSFLSIERKTT